MLKIALTGGIGAGKSTVAYLFSLMGVPVYIADARAKALMVDNEDVKRQVKALFGRRSYFKDGQLNRSFIAEKVFKDRSALQELNAIIHPAVQHDFEQWCDRQNAPYVIEESAIIYEIKAQDRFDKVILVVADDATRIARVMQRDGVDRASVEERMSHQMDQEEKIKLADFVIDNNGHISLIKQIFKIHSTLRDLNNKACL